MKSILIGWLGGSAVAVIVITILWAIGFWPRSQTASFALGMVIGGGFTIAGISIASHFEERE